MVKHMEKETASKNKQPLLTPPSFSTERCSSPHSSSLQVPSAPTLPPPNPAAPKSLQFVFHPPSTPTHSSLLTACLTLRGITWQLFFWDLSWYSKQKENRSTEKRQWWKWGQETDNIIRIQDLIGKEWGKLKVLRGTNLSTLERILV